MGTNELLALPVDLALLYSQRRDRAIGLNGAGKRTASLAAYRARQQRAAMSQLAQAAFYRALTQECQAKVKKLIKQARTPEARRAALEEVERLQALAEQAAAKLEAMNNG